MRRELTHLAVEASSTGARRYGAKARARSLARRLQISPCVTGIARSSLAEATPTTRLAVLVLDKLLVGTSAVDRLTVDGSAAGERARVDAEGPRAAHTGAGR